MTKCDLIRVICFVSGTSGTVKKLTVMERIFNICKTYAMSKDSCGEACAYLASKFLIRFDKMFIF